MKKAAISFFFFLIFLALYVFTNPVMVFKMEQEKVSTLSVSPEHLKADVAALTGTPEARNYKNLNSLNQAANYVKQEFEKQQIAVTEQKYMVYGVEYKNIICSFGPGNGERLVSHRPSTC